MSTIRKIPACNFDRLQAEIAELNRKARKLGCPEAKITVHGEEIVVRKHQTTGIEHKSTLLLVSVEGEMPKLAGWRLVAAVERLESGENLIRAVPGEEVPQQYRNVADGWPKCEHCRHDRRRKEVFVVGHDDGRYAQVGRQCLGDFLGTVSPETLLNAAELIFSADDLAEDACEDFWGCGGGEKVHNLDLFVRMTSIVVRKCGWVPRSASKFEGDPAATANVVDWLCSPPTSADDRRRQDEFIRDNKIEIDAKDEKLADEAIAWGQALPTNAGDYIYNLGVAVRLGFVRPKTVGIVASLISAYLREQAREIERTQRAAKVRGHVGTPDKREGFRGLKVMSVRSFESNFGVKTLIRFEDEPGNILIWWASGDIEWLEQGDTVDVTATVKKHDDYKGTPQTVLQRVVKGIKEPKRKKAAA